MVQNKRNPSYSEKEIQIIKEEITKNPSNLSTAFKTAGSKIGRSFYGISNFYYGYLKNSTTNFTLTSDRVTLPNTKIVANKTSSNEMASKLLEYMISMLTKEEKLSIVKRFINEL